MSASARSAKGTSFGLLPGRSFSFGQIFCGFQKQSAASHENMLVRMPAAILFQFAAEESHGYFSG